LEQALRVHVLLVLFSKGVRWRVGLLDLLTQGKLAVGALCRGFDGGDALLTAGTDKETLDVSGHFFLSPCITLSDGLKFLKLQSEELDSSNPGALMEGVQRPQGSFGMPEHLKKQMEEHHRAKVNPPKEEPAAATVAPPTPDAPETEEAKKARENQENMKKAKQFWEEQLEVRITSKDIQDYIFKGRLTKEEVYIASIPDDKDPEKFTDFKVTFQSHTPGDLSEIDEKMAEYRNKAKWTADGLENEKSLLTLSYVLMSADGRSLGKTPDERYKNIKNLSGGIVSLIAEAWDGLQLLIRYALRQKKLLKR
jgi:hypothetical protein